MANKLILDNGDQTINIGFDAEVVGSNATETVVVEAGADVSFGAGDNDRVEVAGNLADYTVTANGANGLTLTHTDGSVITLSGLTTTGATVAFADGSAPVAVNLDTGAGTLVPTLGGQEVNIDGTTALDTSTVTLDATDPSGGNTDGQTLALTADADSLFGTANNDTFSGTADGANSGTFNTADVLADSSTTDNDTLNITATDDVTETATVAGIENVNFNLASFDTATSAGTFNVNAANIAASTITLDVTQVGSTLANAAATGIKTGSTVAFSDDFTTIDVTAADNSTVTVNTAGDNAGLTLASTSGNVSNLVVNATDDVTLTDVDTADGALTATSTGTITISDAEGVTEATLSAVGTGTAASVWTETDNTAALETLNLSGNGAAAEFTAADGDLVALATVNITGDQDVTVGVSAADVNGLTDSQLTVTDSSTGTSTLDFHTAGSVDTTNIATDVIEFSDDFAGETITAAAGQTLTFSADQGATATLTAPAAGAATNVLTVNLQDDETAGSAVDAQFSVTNVKELTINANDTGTTDSVLTALNVGATNNVTVNAVAGVDFLTSITANKLTLNTASTTATALGTLGATTLGELDASGSTGAITVTLGSELDTVATGSGADTITLDENTSATVDGNEGIDIVDFAAGDFTAETISLTDIEILHLDNTANVDASMLSGQSFIVTDTTASAAVTVTLDQATVDLGSLSVDASKITEIDYDATAQAVAGNAINVTGTATTDDLDATGATNVVTANLGDGDDTVTATGSANDVLTLGKGDDTVTDSGAGNDTIDLGAGDDILTTAGAGDDIITAGEGSDVIVGGAGADAIDLTETTSVADYVHFAALTDGSAAGSVAGTFTGFDVITGFTSGTDELVFDSGTAAANVTVDTPIADGNVVVLASNGAASDGNDLVVGDVTDVDAVVAFLNDTSTSFSAAASADIIAITFNGTTALYATDDTGSDDILVASDVVLLGTVDATLVAGDINIA